MSDDNLAQAKTAVESVLNILDVVRVVYVDDAHNENIAVEDIIVAAQVLDTGVLSTTLPELGDSIPDDPDILAKKIRDVWEQLDPDVQVERGQSVVTAAQQKDDDQTNDLAYISILNQLISKEKLISLSPTQWETQKDQFIQESKSQRTLFLFDRDLSKAGGESEGGIKIIAWLLSIKDIENLICGLLTHTVTPETQPQAWTDLSHEHGISRDRFVVIPKLHLSTAPMLFARALKFAALSPDFTELKCKTKEITNQAAQVAADRIEKVSIYDLEHIVFRISAEEGLWEPDMLFRLHAMFHHHESRKLAHAGRELESIAAKLRAVSGISIGSDFSPPDSTWALQHEELYEPGDHVNNNHLPLELGDIFEREGSGSDKKYILLAQPCDLMVRSDGKRHPELKRVALAEVVQKEERPNYSEEMPYFDELPAKKWFVKMKAIHFAHICVLDLCSYNQDGSAKLALGTDVPSEIRPSWKKRHSILNRHWDKIAKKYESTINQTQATGQIGTNLSKVFFDDDLFKGELIKVNGENSITYNCKRVGRLSRTRAIGLLMSYTATLGRPAYDRDFSKN